MISFILACSNNWWLERTKSAMEVARKDDLAGNVISRQSPTKFSLLSVKAILGMRAVLYCWPCLSLPNGN